MIKAKLLNQRKDQKVAVLSVSMLGANLWQRIEQVGEWKIGH